MKNLKKVLALVLAFACAFTMFAGAAFSDQADIQSADAVDALTALGVIEGYTDGSFRPDTTVTRAEMAKMIFTILNGGNDDASAYENLPTSFTDLTEDWYKGYIKYLQNSDIIAGTSATTFAPNETVTGVEAAKMMLVAAGYTPDKAGLTGLSWRVNTMRYANANSLFADVNCDINSGLPRQYAAQIMYNALDMENVVYSKDIDGFKPATDVNEDKTIGGKYMDLITYEGVLTGSGDFGASKDKIRMGEIVKVNGDASVRDDNGNLPSDTWDYEEDVTNLVGQYVKVMTGKNDKVYGVFAVNSENTVVTAALSDIEKVSRVAKVKVDGTEYKFETGANIYDANNDVYAQIADLSTSAKNSADTITFVSNDGDDTFDRAYINPIQKVAKVTYVSDDSFTAGDEYDFAEVVAPSDLAKGDYVVKTTDLFTGDDKFVKADLVSGKITSTKGGSTITDIKLADSDEWYQVAAAQTIDGENIIGMSGDALARDNSYDLVLVNGVVYNADKTASGSSDTALVTGASTALDTDGNMQVKLLFADGSEKVVPADDDYTGKKTSDGTAFVTYDTDDGVYTVTSVSQLNTEGKIEDTFGDGYKFVGKTATKDTAGFDADKDRLDGKRVADDATIYVQYVDGEKNGNPNVKTTVITGAELNAMGSNFGVDSYYVYSGTLITEALIVGNTYLPGASADKLYGYVTSSVTETSDDGTDYQEFTVWTSEGESIDVKMKASTTIEKEDLISFELAADNFIEGVKVLKAQTGAIKSFGSDYVILYNDGKTGTTDYDLDDDVKFLYLNTKDVKGINGGELTEAAETATDDVYYANIKYYTEGTGADEKIVMIAIDVTRNQFSVGGNVQTITNE